MTIADAVTEQFPDATPEQIAAIVAAAQEATAAQVDVWRAEAERVQPLATLVGEQNALLDSLANLVNATDRGLLYQRVQDAITAAADQPPAVVEVPVDSPATIAAREAVVRAGFPIDTAPADVIDYLAARRPAEVIVPLHLRDGGHDELIYGIIASIREAAGLPDIDRPYTMDEAVEATVLDLLAARLGLDPPDAHVVS